MINKRLEDLREVMRREHLAACASRGDRHLGYSSRHTQVPVPATTLDTLACFVTEVEEN